MEASFFFFLFLPLLLRDFHASQSWRCWNTKKVIPSVQNSSQGDGFKRFPTANAPIGNSLKKRCCIQFHLCWVERDLAQLSRYLGQLISLTRMLTKQGLCPVPSECKDNVPTTFRDDRIRLPVLNTSELLLSALELGYLLTAEQRFGGYGSAYNRDLKQNITASKTAEEIYLCRYVFGTDSTYEYLVTPVK